MLLFLHRELINTVPLFDLDSQDPKFVTRILMAMKPLCFSPEEVIIEEGDVGNEMYIILKGEVLVTNKDQKTIYAREEAGTYFGEVALVRANTLRTATVKAATFVDLVSLSKVFGRENSEECQKKYAGYLNFNISDF